MKLFDKLLNQVRGETPQRIAVAAAHDKRVLEAVFNAKERGVGIPILVGQEDKIRQFADELGIDLQDTTIIHEPNHMEAALYASNMVRQGEADLLMKGILHTAEIMRAVLNREKGLRQGNVISHTAILEIEGFDRLLFVTDAGMVIDPSLDQKIEIIRNASVIAKALGIEMPKVAVLSALEIVNPNMPSSLDGSTLTQMNRRGQIQGCIVDGPLALDTAVSVEKASHKDVKGSEVAGVADILLVPNIETGNAIYKAATTFANFRSAGIIFGAKVPIVLPSRADTAESKFLSIVVASRVAAYLAEQRDKKVEDC